MKRVEERFFAEQSQIAEWDEPALPQQTAQVEHTEHEALLAHAALLDNVVVAQQTDQEAFRLVKGHLKLLEQWHERHTGWRIQRGTSFFRLERHLHLALPVFLDEKLKEARDFACLAWILWFAEKRYLAGGGRHQQFLLSQLTEEIQGQTREEDQRKLDIRNVQDRYSMRRSLEYLVNLGCLQVLEGEIKKWTDDSEQEKNEVLYEFTPLAHSLIEALNTRRVAALQAALQNNPGTSSPRALSAFASEIPPLIRAWRNLLLGPVLLRYDDVEAFAALSTQAEQVSEELGAAFGWSLELNRDYACVVRGGGITTGAGPTISFQGAYDQMLLLLCGQFREQVQQGEWIPDEYGCVQTTRWQIFPLFNALRQRYGSYWGATVRDAGADSLLAEIYRRMRQVGLLRGPDADGTVLILPTAARYSVSYTTLQDQPEAHTTTRSTRTRKQRTLPKNTPTLFDPDKQE